MGLCFWRMVAEDMEFLLVLLVRLFLFLIVLILLLVLVMVPPLGAECPIEISCRIESNNLAQKRECCRACITCSSTVVFVLLWLLFLVIVVVVVVSCPLSLSVTLDDSEMVCTKPVDDFSI